MKKMAYLTWIFAVILIVGGVIGYLKAGSLASIINSSIFALFFGWSGSLFYTSKPYAKKVNLILLSIIFIFFAVRFFLTLKWVPLAIMSLSAGMLLSIIFWPVPDQRSNR